MLFALMGGVSALTCGTPAFAQAGPPAPEGQQAPAGTPAPAEQVAAAAAVDEIIVTGTRIQGVAPVGSALIQVDQKTIQNTGLTSTADILNTIPSVLRLGSGNAYAGGQAQQSNTLTAFTFLKSPNIRGLGVGATLSLVNGHRVAYEGGNMNAFDGDNYPAQMIQRIDVVQDGGSALYGADAIAGTVNYILREPDDVFEMYGGYSTNEGSDSHFVTGIVGKKWGEGDNEGGFIASYQYSFQNAFSASSRPDLYNDDLSPFGGPGLTEYAAPGNIVVNGRLYSIPRGQDGRSLTLSQLGTTPNRTSAWTGIETIPQVEAHRFAINSKQRVTDWLQLFAEGMYVERKIAISGPGGAAGNRAAQFGAVPRIPNSNPFSPCNPSRYPGGIVTGPAELVAACATGALSVAYTTIYDIGGPRRTGKTQTWHYGGGANVTLPAEWKLDLSIFAGGHDSPSVTSQIGGAPLPDLATFNFFCDPTAFQCTDTATRNSINARATQLLNRTKYTFEDYSANLSGSLFSLPAGEVKAAIGAQYYKARLLNENNFGGNTNDPRTVKSIYGELFVPIVGPDAEVPLINRLEINLSGRYDKYSDAGSTKNPRIGFNWWPVDGLKIYGSYGTSFHAPGLADNNPFSQTSVLPTTIQGTQINSAVCLACQTLGTGAIYQTIGGANGDLKPETAKTYSLGVDWTPRFASGLTASLKYWRIDFKNQVNAPAYNVGSVAAINRGIYNSQIIYNPSFFPTLAANNPVAFFGSFPTINAANPNCAAALGQRVTTQAIFDNVIRCFNTGGERGGLFGAPVDPSRVVGIVNGRRVNSGTTKGDGFDISLNYRFDSDWGSWNLGAVGEYILHWRVSPIQGAPFVDEVNKFTFPLRFKGRAQIGWNKDVNFGRLIANLFMNYTNKYRLDPSQLPIGVPTRYAKIGDNTTFDLTVGFNTGDEGQSVFTKDVGFTLSVQNLFNQDPPLVINAAGLAGSAVRFDPTYGSPLGRVIQFQVSKKF